MGGFMLCCTAFQNSLSAIVLYTYKTSNNAIVSTETPQLE